ncbi:non-ribosomal peptide synthetase [Chitinophaga sp. W2I13]|uniref:non-ribosomal peptide synthetase n=1 Tax=Chitinophaga sp. W2I13 TaxID=3373923 RepID=UPI003D1CF60D
MVIRKKCWKFFNIALVKQAVIRSIKLTPAHINILKELSIKSSSMQCAIIGGEEVKQEHVKILRNINPNIRIYNEYGPTETTVGCAVKELEEDTPILIGKPVANTRMLILDHELRLCAPGVSGEIYIGGAGLAQGYLNKPDITTEKFIPDPYAPGSLLYRTGDVGWWMPDGDIGFLGRADDQVKIRGYRVEPGEVENLLQAHIDIDIAVVVATGKPADKHLVAYITSKQPINPEVIRTYLSGLIPEFMIPARFEQVAAFPLTPNGKIDRKSLQASLQPAHITANVYLSPANETEERLLHIWQELLGKETISMEDNFFALGGHSLNGMKLLAQIHREFNVIIKVKDFFDKATIREISNEVMRIEWLKKKHEEHIDNLIPEKSFTL